VCRCRSTAQAMVYGFCCPLQQASMLRCRMAPRCQRWKSVTRSSWPRSSRCQTGRACGGTAKEVRVRGQPEDGEDPRADHSAGVLLGANPVIRQVANNPADFNARTAAGRKCLSVVAASSESRCDRPSARAPARARRRARGSTGSRHPRHPSATPSGTGRPA